ncbi:MAG: sugar ABC transporter substrate-binding protein [Caldilineaceae bacterium]|nr:sugar ABC transporter substrate-binding protein [Caldilineaceae bacterium]
MPKNVTTQIAESTPPPARRLSRRAFLQLGLATVGLTISSCVLLDGDSFTLTKQRNVTVVATPAQEEIQLVYQDWRTDWFPAMVQEMLAQFHAANPHVRVFFTPDPDNLADKMLAEMAAGTAPDVFWGGSTFFPTWAQQGHMLDLRAYVAADLDSATIADWDPAQYRAFFLPDGRQFGLPKYHGAVALYYNKDLFDADGVAYPTAAWTHKDYQTAMQTLSHDHTEGQRERWGSMLDVAWDRLQLHVNGWGGHMVSPQNPQLCTFGRPKALAALAWLRTAMWEERVIATFPDVQYMSPRSAFINQRVAMVEEGSWVLKDILLNADFRVGVAPMPSGPARRVTMATSDGFGIYNGTQYPAAAWELLKFLTGPAYGEAMAQANFLQPARASLLGAWMGYVQAEFPEKSQDLDLAAFADGHVKGYSVTVEIAANMAEVQPKVAAAFEKVFTLGQAPVTYLQGVCDQINQTQERVLPTLPLIPK